MDIKHSSEHQNTISSDHLQWQMEDLKMTTTVTPDKSPVAADLVATATTTTTPTTIPDKSPVAADLVALFATEFNKRLPCRIRFGRSAQVEGSTPGLDDHTGWMMQITQTFKRNNPTPTFEFDVAFLDPISVDTRTKTVSVVPHESRQWKLFSLCAFAHTCYWNWDVQGRVSSGSIYTCSSYANVEIEVEKETYVSLSRFFSVSTVGPSRFPLKNEQCPVLLEGLCKDRPSCRRKLFGRGQLSINPRKQHFPKHKYNKI